MPKLFKIFALLIVFTFAHHVKSQTNVNSLGTPVTETFNTLPTSGAAAPWSQNSTVSGWYAYETDPHVKAIEIMADSGAQNSGRLYSYGRAASTERALGSLGSGSTDSIVYGWRLKNNTGVTVTAVDISYTGEQWRRAANANVNKLVFYYKVASSITSIDSTTIKNLTSNGYTNYSALNFEGPITGTTASILNGNDPANSKTISQSITVSIPAGQEIMILWFDDDDASNDHGLAIDDVSVTFSNQDKTPPSISSVTLNSATSMSVKFSEKVTNLSATDTANYKFTPKLNISSITYDTATQTATLNFSMVEGKYYSLSINNIVDIAIALNIQTTAFVASKLIYNGYKAGKLIISEIFYNDPSANDNYEFIEITNSGNSDIELGGIKFTTGITYTFEEYKLEAGKSISIAKIKDSCIAQFGTAFLGSFAGSLDNAGEKIVLSNSINEVIDSVRYGDDSGWPIQADGQGYSLQLKTPFFQVDRNDFITSWSINSKEDFKFQNGTTIWATPNDVPKSLVTISEIKQNDTNGVNLALNSKVEIRGTVYGINFEAAGLSFLVRDATDGIMTFSLNNFGYTVTEGDSVELKGKVVQSQGLSVLLLDTITKLGTSVTGLKQATTIVLPEEKYESDIVKYFSLKLAENITKWPTDGFVKLVSGTDTIRVYIDSETNIDGTNLPAALSFNLTGFLLQSSVSPKLDDGYFLILRSTADIDFTAAPDPEVYFTTSNVSASERGKATIEVKINNPSANPTTITIEKIGGTASSGTDYLSTFPINVQFPGGSSANQTFSINMVNDIVKESNETIQLVIRSADNNAGILADSIVTITIIDNDNPLYTIGVASKVDAVTGVPDSNNVKVQVKGIVYGVNYRPSGLQFTIRDNTGGIGIFNPTGLGYTVTEGDEIIVSGTVNHFRGLTQISFIDTLIKISSGNALNAPAEVKKLNEFAESNLVKLRGLRWAQNKPSTWTANANFKLTNGIDTFEIRVDGDINLAGTPVPTYDTLNITGIGGQFSISASGPFLNGYQLLPRYIADIEKYNSRIYPIGVISKVNALTGVPDSNNVRVNVKGIVYGVNYRGTGLSFTLRDNTGGITIFKPSGNFGYTVTEGDELWVSGIVTHFRGLTEIANLDTLIKLGSGNTLKSPVEITKLAENYESDLVVVKKLTWAQAKPANWTSNTNFLFTNGTDTVMVRIDDDINLQGTALPAYDTMNITGLVGQFATKSAGPFLDGYQLFPRYTTDITKWINPNSGSVKHENIRYIVFPNPTNGEFTIECERTIDNIEIVNIAGQTVYTLNQIKSNSLVVNAELASGIYFLKIQSGSDVQVQRIAIK